MPGGRRWEPAVIIEVPSMFQLRDGIEARFRAIFELELSGSVLRSVLSWVGAHTTQKEAADYVIGAMQAYLKKVGL
jgi:hypothetical protein